MEVEDAGVMLEDAGDTVEDEDIGFGFDVLDVGAIVELDFGGSGAFLFQGFRPKFTSIL